MESKKKTDTEKPKQSVTEYVTRDMVIGEIIEEFPYVAEIIMAHGIHCVGCGAANWETLEDGLYGHGLTPGQVDAIFDEINAYIDDHKKNHKDAPQGSGKKASKEITITENAAEKVKHFLKDKDCNGLRISITPGGCSGFQYNFQLEDTEKENDTVIEVKGVKFYIDDKSLAFLEGSTVDYVDTLQGAGFKVTNPNAESTCGCGESFS